MKGRAAHAGVAPQDGRNAAAELVHQLAALNGVFALSGNGTTVNLTLLSGGTRVNIIPEDAEAAFSVRYRRMEDLQPVLARMQQSAATTQVPDTVVTVVADPGFPPLIETPEVDALAARAERIYGEIGRKIGRGGNGGASESAVAQAAGIPALDGLGPVGGDFHTDHEWVDLTSFTPTALPGHAPADGRRRQAAAAIGRQPVRAAPAVLAAHASPWVIASLRCSLRFFRRLTSRSSQVAEARRTATAASRSSCSSISAASRVGKAFTDDTDSMAAPSVEFALPFDRPTSPVFAPGSRPSTWLIKY